MRRIPIKCPECGERGFATLKTNSWVKCIDSYCMYCDWEDREINLDYIQPSSPFFKHIYGNDPYTEYEAKKKQRLKEEEQRRVELEEKYAKLFRDPLNKHIRTEEEKFVKRKVLEEE